jgi:hypothetical protein
VCVVIGCIVVKIILGTLAIILVSTLSSLFLVAEL